MLLEMPLSLQDTCGHDPWWLLRLQEIWQRRNCEIVPLYHNLQEAFDLRDDLVHVPPVEQPVLLLLAVPLASTILPVP